MASDHHDHDHDDPHTAPLTETHAVRFTARELWGDAASPRDPVYIDPWDDHLGPA